MRKLIDSPNGRSSEPRVLDLVLSRRQFEEVLSGAKREIFRVVCNYWRAKLRDHAYREVFVRTDSVYDKRFVVMPLSGISIKQPPGLDRDYYSIQFGAMLRSGDDWSVQRETDSQPERASAA